MTPPAPDPAAGLPRGLLVALFDSAPDAMLAVDGDGRIVVANAQAERLFGYPRRELVGKRVEELMPERFRAAHPGHRAGYMAHPKVREMGARLELHGRRSDGTEFPVEVSLSPIAADGRTLVGSAIRDVTERRQQAAALQVANQELEAFAYTISHDLRAPLRAMAGFAQLLLDDHGAALGADARHDADMIVEGAREMGALVDALLGFSRLARQPLALEPVDPAAVAAKALDGQADALRDRDARVTIAPMPPCRADPTLLQQVYANLLSNAIKYTRKRPHAEVAVGWDPAARAYFVRDNGVGFDPAHAGQLFGVFQRLHRAEEYEGAGVGLAIVQRIVARHGGKVWADALPDRGATFCFTLGGA